MLLFLSGTYPGMVTQASPTGEDHTCVCYKNMIGVNPSISRVPYGGCSYKYARGENLGISPLSKECSKALWQFPITKFDESYDIGYGFGDGDKDRPYGDGLFDEKVHEYAHDLIDDADWNWRWAEVWTSDLHP